MSYKSQKQARHILHPWPRRVNKKTGRSEVRVGDVWVSRQRAWQLIRVLEGNCARCGKAREHFDSMCDRCYRRALVHKREVRGLKPWVPGGPGRPPKGTEKKERAA